MRGRQKGRERGRDADTHTHTLKYTLTHTHTHTEQPLARCQALFYTEHKYGKTREREWERKSEKDRVRKREILIAKTTNQSDNQSFFNTGVAQLKVQYKDIFQRLDQTKAFQGLFSTLWYAPLPCFDSKGMTANKEGEKSGKL